MSRCGGEGAATLGTRCEIKNLNSFRFMQQAIEYEVRRQIELIDDGGTVVQETRLFDPERGETRSMRSKEDAQDYRYFPDPDLPPLAIDDAWIERVRSGMPELPEAMRERFVFEYALPAQDAVALTADRETACYFETAAKSLAGPAEKNGKLVANWVLGELSAALNRDERAIGAAPVRAAAIGGVVAADQRRHDFRQDRQGRLRRHVGGRAPATLTRSSPPRAWNRFRTPARSRGSSTTCWQRTPLSSPNSAPAKRRPSSRSSARRWRQPKARPTPRR